MQKNAIFSCFLVYIIIYMSIINASHFEGGTITYKVLNTSGSIVSVVITQTYIYDYTKINCNNSMIANQSPKLTFNSPYVENSVKVNCIQYCNQSGGYKAPSVVSYCTDYSVDLGITVGQRSDIINITNGSYFLVAYQSYSWRSLSLPSGLGSSTLDWSISCLINLKMRPGGGYNTPPVATVISPIYIPVAIRQNIAIPTIDADNDLVRCRFANGTNECGSTCPPASLPNGTILFSNCTLIITGAKVNDWYAVTIQIEDFINSTSTTPLSSVPVQFLINVQNVSFCSRRPLLTGPVSQTGGCVGIQVGQSYVIKLTAENFCPNSTTIEDIATLSFAIVIKTPIVRNTTTLWSITLTWTPTAAAVGSQILCSVAVDSTNVQSNQYCMAFTVGQGNVPACPGEVAATTQLTTYKTIMTTQVTSTKLTTIITSLPSATTALHTSISSLSQNSSSLSTWLSTIRAILTSQSNLQSTTYTSLISTIQATTSLTITQHTFSSSSQSNSTLSSWLNTTNATLNSQSNFEYTTNTSPISYMQSTTSLTTASSTSGSSLSQSSFNLSPWLDVTSATVTDDTDFEYSVDTSLISAMQSTTNIINIFDSSLSIESSDDSTMEITNSFDTSTNTLQSVSSIVSSTMVLEQSSNADQNSDTTESIVTSSSSNSTSFWSWIPILLALLALILLALCICCCCWYCCPRLCPCCPCKRRRKRQSLDEITQETGSIQPSIHPDIIDHDFENGQHLDEGIFITIRPSSVASSRNADDIQLTGLTSPRKEKTIPHYATPLNRSPRVAPKSPSPDEYFFGSRHTSKFSQR